MKAKILTPLFFCFLVTILFANLPLTKAVQLTQVGNANYNLVTNYNPAYVLCYNKETLKTDALYVLVNYTGSGYTAEIKIWKIEDGQLLDSESITLASANILLGAQVIRYVGYGSYDGFWVLTVQLTCDNVNIKVTLYARAWFYNYTAKTSVYLGEKSAVVIDPGSSLTATHYMYQIVFGNPIYLSGRTWVSFQTHMCFQKGVSWTYNGVFGGIFGLDTTTISGNMGVIGTTGGTDPTKMDVYWATTQYSDGNPDLITALMFYRNNADYTTIALLTWSISTNTLSIYPTQLGTTSLITKSGCIWRGITPTTIKKIPMFKPVGIQKAVSGGYNYFTFYIPITYTSIGQTKMQYGTWVAPYTFSSWGSFNHQTLYILNGVVYCVDARDPYSAISDAYFYSPSGVFFNAGYDAESGVKTILIQLGVTPSEKVYITGQQTFWMWDSTTNKITLYILATAIPTVYEVDVPAIPETPSPEEPDYPSLVVSWGITAFLIPAMFLVFPAVLFGMVLGSLGVLLGLSLGVAIGFMSGIFPAWLLVVIALAMGVIFFSKMQKGEMGGGSE